MEEGLWKVHARKIEAECSEEGDRGGEGRNELCSAPFEQRKKKEMREREYAHGVGEGGMLGLNATYGNDRGKARRPARGGNRRRSR